MFLSQINCFSFFYYHENSRSLLLQTSNSTAQHTLIVPTDRVVSIDNTRFEEKTQRFLFKKKLMISTKMMYTGNWQRIKSNLFSLFIKFNFKISIFNFIVTVRNVIFHFNYLNKLIQCSNLSLSISLCRRTFHAYLLRNAPGNYLYIKEN